MRGGVEKPEAPRELEEPGGTSDDPGNPEGNGVNVDLPSVTGVGTAESGTRSNAESGNTPEQREALQRALDAQRPAMVVGEAQGDSGEAVVPVGEASGKPRTGSTATAANPTSVAPEILSVEKRDVAETPTVSETMESPSRGWAAWQMVLVVVLVSGALAIVLRVVLGRLYGGRI